MNKLALCFLFLVSVTQSYCQEKISVLFKSDDYRIAPLFTDSLNVLMQGVNCEHCSIAISAHTDSDGSDEYNIELSKKRLQSVKSYFEKNFSCVDILHQTFHGEKNPVAPNGNEAVKGLNRRVEVVLKCQEAVDSIQDIWPVLKSLGPKPASFIFQGEDGGVFTLDNGTKVVVAENTFPNGKTELQVYDGSNYRNAFLYGLTTMSKDKVLESAGMYRYEAFQNGSLLPNKSDYDVQFFIPLDSDNFKKFNSKQNGNYTDWDSKGEAPKQYVSPFRNWDNLYRGDGCGRNLTQTSSGDNISCSSWLCKIRCFFFKKWCTKQVDESRNYVATCLFQNSEFLKLYNLYSDELKERFPDAESFAKYLAATPKEKVESDLKSLIPDFETVRYFVMQPVGFRWINCDAFPNVQNFTEVTIDEESREDVDIRLYFKGVNGIMRPSQKSEGKSKFNKVPVGKIVTLVIVKKVNDVIKMCKESFTVGDEPPAIQFKEVTPGDLEKIDI